MAWMSKALLPLDELSIKAELLLLWFQMQREARPLSGAIPGHGQRDVDGEDGNNLGRVTQITARPFLLVYIGVKLGECCARLLWRLFRPGQVCENGSGISGQRRVQGRTKTSIVTHPAFEEGIAMKSSNWFGRIVLVSRAGRHCGYDCVAKCGARK